jgi:putative peptide zinc metalloprotease protein
MVAFAFPVIAIGLLLTRMGRSLVTWVWKRTAGRPFRRGVAVVTLAGMLAGLAWVWWPDADRYRPVLPFEGGTLQQAVATPLQRVGIEVPVQQASYGGLAQTVLPAGQPLPTQDAPVPALVLIPRADAASPDEAVVEPGDTVDPGDTGVEPGGEGSVPEGEEPSGPATEAPTWVFPFNEPLPPGEGDNQALAVNTTDNSVKYDVAMAMVWVEDDRALNTNEAIALSSCSNCVSVAVAFQVVVIVGQADVIVPQNLSTAANYDCFECITAAVASQLVVTVDALPGEPQQIALADLWAEISAYAATIPQRSLVEIMDQLDAYKAEILDILGVQADELGLGSDEASPSPSTGPGEGPSPTSSTSPSPTGSPSPTPVTGDEAGTATGSDSDSGTDTESDAGTGSTTTGGSSSSGSSTPAPSPTPTRSSSPTPTAESSPSPTSTASP